LQTEQIPDKTCGTWVTGWLNDWLINDLQKTKINTFSLALSPAPRRKQKEKKKRKNVTERAAMKKGSHRARFP
jgi:hypothetical protein